MWYQHSILAAMCHACKNKTMCHFSGEKKVFFDVIFCVCFCLSFCVKTVWLLFLLVYRFMLLIWEVVVCTQRRFWSRTMKCLLLYMEEGWWSSSMSLSGFLNLKKFWFFYSFLLFGLCLILGSNEKAMSSHVYSYSNGFRGFAAKLSEEQALEIAGEF